MARRIEHLYDFHPERAGDEEQVPARIVDFLCARSVSLRSFLTSLPPLTPEVQSALRDLHTTLNMTATYVASLYYGRGAISGDKLTEVITNASQGAPTFQWERPRQQGA